MLIAISGVKEIMFFVCVNGFDSPVEFTVLRICQTRLFKYFRVLEGYTFLEISLP